MESILPSPGDAYSSKWIQKRLVDDFQDEIMTTNINGKSNVVTFTSTASKILPDFHAVSEDEKLRILSAAAKIIRCEIKAKE